MVADMDHVFPSGNMRYLNIVPSPGKNVDAPSGSSLSNLVTLGGVFFGG